MLDIQAIYEANKHIIRYICWGREECPTTKNEHNQGWVQFRNKKRLGGVRTMFLHGVPKVTIHLESCKGSPEQNDTYCKKEGHWTHLGAWKTQGCRTDSEVVTEAIMSGTRLNKVMLDNPEYTLRYHSGMARLKEAYLAEQQPEWRNIKTIVRYGPTGTGKSRAAYNDIRFPDRHDKYLITGDQIKQGWWPGYNGQKYLIIDEYANHVNITQLLTLLRGYPIKLERKGGHIYPCWTHVCITTNLTRDEFHPCAKPEHRNALNERVEQWIHMT